MIICDTDRDVPAYHLDLWSRLFLVFLFLLLQQTIPKVERIRSPQADGKAMLSVRTEKLSVEVPVFIRHPPE